MSNVCDISMLAGHAPWNSSQINDVNPFYDVNPLNDVLNDVLHDILNDVLNVNVRIGLDSSDDSRR
jgi:hypothetical protein